MKFYYKLLSFLFIFIFLFSTLISCNEQEEEQVSYSEGLEYLSHFDGTCEVKSKGTCLDTAIRIPEKSPVGDTIDKIGNYAFQSDSTITSISFPSTLTAIGLYAFAGCSNLKNIILPDAITTISSFAFSNCSSITYVLLGSSLRSIGDSAFAGCNSVEYCFYHGSITYWNYLVSVGDLNSAITFNGVLYFYSATTPTYSGCYWYYKKGSICLW